MISSETRLYLSKSTGKNAALGLPLRAASSENSHALEIGKAERMPYSRAL